MKNKQIVYEVVSSPPCDDLCSSSPSVSLSSIVIITVVDEQKVTITVPVSSVLSSPSVYYK